MSEQSNGANEAEANAAAGAAGEEELRRALEEQLKEVSVEEVLVQSVVGLVNITARRISIPEERDLGQARLGIDSVRALLDLLPAEVAVQVRDAVSRLQLEFARVSGGDDGGGGGGEGGGGEATGPSGSGAGGPGGSGLWTPPGTV